MQNAVEHRAEPVPWSAAYWDWRYRSGGHSGAGSAGRLARFKARTLNGLVAQHRLASVVEFGCGDGRQLALAHYPAYVGTDVSPEAIRLCAARFAGAADKRFVANDAETGMADLALSLDVVFHLVEDDVFDRYMRRLFGHARRMVVIYASDRDEATADAHVRHRWFSGWIAVHAPQWRPLLFIPNPYPYDASAPEDTSFSDFHVYERVDASVVARSA